jgi:hypothetical protein
LPTRCALAKLLTAVAEASNALVLAVPSGSGTPPSTTRLIRAAASSTSSKFTFWIASLNA